MSNQTATGKIQRPRSDDRPLFDLCFGILGFPVVLVAHDLKLFSLLGEEPRTQSEICKLLNIAPRPAEAILGVCVSRGLVRVEGGRYSLTPVAEDYLLESSPTFFGGFLDLWSSTYSVYSFENLKKAVLTDSPQVYGGEDWIKSHEEQDALARVFTRGMHGHSVAPAMAWPEAVDLSGHRLLLDIGGGSGAHSIGAARRWPNLKAVVLDLAPVCEVAEDFIAREGLESSIETQVGDIWNDPFPKADIHFYSNVYQSFPPEKCRLLTRKSFESLEPGGRMIIHEILYNDERTGPFAAAAFNVVMLLWVEGRQYSGRELSAMLADAGFTDIEVKPTFGYWGIATGQKP